MAKVEDPGALLAVRAVATRDKAATVASVRATATSSKVVVASGKRYPRSPFVKHGDVRYEHTTILSLVFGVLGLVFSGGDDSSSGRHRF